MGRKYLNNKKHYVYALIDPFDLKIRYIGLTHNIKNRKRLHRTSITHSSNEDLLTWITDIRDNGSVPEFKILKECDNYDDAHRIEVMLIQKLGDQLLNTDHNVYRIRKQI